MHRHQDRRRPALALALAAAAALAAAPVAARASAVVGGAVAAAALAPPVAPPLLLLPPPDVLQMKLIAAEPPSFFTDSNKAELEKRLALCNEQINTKQITVKVGPTQSTISSVLKFSIVANGPFTPLVIVPPSTLVTLLQTCLGINDLALASDVLGLGTIAKPGVLTAPEYSIMVPQSPAPSPAPSPPPPPPVPVGPAQNKITLVTGWQMNSFQYLVAGGTFDVIINTLGFSINDKIMARMGSLKIATYDGVRWQGELVEIGLFFKYGYKIYADVGGGVITQMGVNQDPVENIQLTKGWNWVGNPILQCTDINDLTPCAGGGQFTVDDQMKARKTDVKVSTYDGDDWQGNIPCLANGTGYEIFIAQALTLCL